MYSFSSAIGLTIGALGYRLIFGGDGINWAFTHGLVAGSWLPLISYLVSHWWSRRAA